MPSDPRVDLALAAIASRRATFRAAVAAARDQVAAHLAAHGSTHDRVADLDAELGRFAGGSVDAARLATILPTASTGDAATARVVRHCADVLDELLDEGDELFTSDVQPGGDLRASTFVALGEAGRAFGAVLAFRAAMTGHYETTKHEPALHSFPFGLWNRAERAIGVPLVIRVAGADLCAESLAEFLDGQQQIVLVVEGPCAPAPLARLVSPGVLVLQTRGDLGALVSFEGPAIAALVPEGAAEFIADPRAGGAVVLHRDGADPKSAVGRWSVAQQREQVAVLHALQQTLGLATPTNMRSDAADETEKAGEKMSSPLPANPPHPTSTFVSVVNPGANDEQLTGAIAGWLLAEAGFVQGATR